MEWHSRWFLHSCLPKRVWYNIPMPLKQKDDYMLSEKVIDLTRSFDALKACCSDLAKSIHDDADLQMFLPNFKGDMHESRELAINAITRLWWPELEEAPVKYGVLRVSRKSADLALALNKAKADFKESIAAVKLQIKDDNKKRVRSSKKDDDKKESREKDRIEKLIERALNCEGSRTPELRRVLANMRIGRLDLKKCYASIRVLPESIRSVSYTWAVTHSTIKKITVEEAMIMAGSLQDTNLQGNIILRLERLNLREILALKKKLPNQLRANTVYSKNDEVKRESITISGIVLCCCGKMPQVIWRDEPGEDEIDLRLQRVDSTIEPKPFIKALNLYRYVNPQLKEPKANNE